MTAALLLNLAGPDLVVIGFIVLLLIAARKLPDLANGMGEAVRSFTEASKRLTENDDESSAHTSVFSLVIAAIFLTAILIFCAKLTQPI